MTDNELNLPLHPHPEQEEMPFAVVQGAPWSTMPKDLYIPPDALEVFLDAFEGPLDLLLYLIKRQNLDILDIPIAQITAQYMEYVDLMKDIRLELAAEYLVMAAMLAEIKSRMLLPRQEDLEDEEGDPRAELIRRLQEYERYKQAAEDIDNLPRLGRDLFQAEADVPDRIIQRRPPDVDLREILFALKEVLHRVDMFSHHHVQMEALSVREKMSGILERLTAESFTLFTDLFEPSEGRLGVVVTFLAILELIKGSLIDMIQAESFGPIHVKAVSVAEH
ncbi:segregation and condensation protein A [Sedimenticola selenatireducens]|uniref:Segregation and condensation protein A n=1 Tax=Sedimenticola selenatireducens TaxID=191960 RepID=A0A558DQU0_9GAMM|nr:ScpA family protein [Sedimenticola selenatireducens]TVO73454.1 segregation/condensation protein A [Sedimenticola selenatireducens]TVT63395.1 MAG: segregation/condensation protein A [Sedimenticola selenatireducens]